MKYVLDSNISLKWVLPEADSDKARRLRGEFQNQIHELHAPDVFPVEVAHALAKAERRGVIPLGDADRLLTNVLSTPPQFHRYLPLLKRALDIAFPARIGVYDCLYVALAEREGCELLTADDRLVRTLQPTLAFIFGLVQRRVTFRAY
jgi:predicted nucleic acid-binding protein